MTILLGFATTEFAMLGTDTRASQRGSAGTRFVDDDTPKVFKTGVGLIAGAGWLDLVRNGILALQDPPASNAEAAQRLRAVRDETGLPSSSPLVAKTSWVLTYQTGDPPNESIGMAYCCPQADYFPQTVNIPGYFLIAPSGMSDEDEERLRAFLEDAVARTVAISSTKGRQRSFASAIQSCVHNAAETCDSVSSKCQLGLHSREGAIVTAAPHSKSVGRLRHRP